MMINLTRVFVRINGKPVWVDKRTWQNGGIQRISRTQQCPFDSVISDWESSWENSDEKIKYLATVLSIMVRMIKTKSISLKT